MSAGELNRAIEAFRRLPSPQVQGLPDVAGADLEILEEAARVLAAAEAVVAGRPADPAGLRLDPSVDARLAAAKPASTRERAAVERLVAYRAALRALAEAATRTNAAPP